MAIYKVINTVGKYHDSHAYQDVIHYVTNTEKVRSDGVLGGAVLPENATVAMEAVAFAYHKDKGVHLRHSVLSFEPDEGVSAEDAKAIAKESIKFYDDDFQILAAVHEDRDHVHIHYVMNTVSYRDGSKYHGEKRDYYNFLKHMNKIVQPYRTYVKLKK